MAARVVVVGCCKHSSMGPGVLSIRSGAVDCGGLSRYLYLVLAKFGAVWYC